MNSFRILALLAQAISLAGPSLADTSGPPRLEPLLNGTWPGFGRGAAWDVEIAGQYLYAALGDGLAVFDISGPAGIVPVGGAKTGGRPLQLRVVGERAYVAAECNGLQVFDVSNPARPL